MYSNYHQSGVLLLVFLAIPTQTSTYPRRRDLTEGVVGERSQIDANDGETWYPVDGISADSSYAAVTEAPPLPLSATKSNDPSSQLLVAVRNLFVKWGYKMNEIPQPFGNGDASAHIRASPEFTSVLELLIEKLPNELDLPILKILRDNGVTQLRIPKGLENSAELRRIDNIIFQIENSLPEERSIYQQNRDSPADTNTYEKDDGSRYTMANCGSDAGPCPDGGFGNAAHVMDHPDMKAQQGKLLIAQVKTSAEDAATIKKDKTELSTLLEDVKKKVKEAKAKPLEVEIQSKVAEELNLISQKVAEVELIAEKNIKILGESPCEGVGSNSLQDKHNANLEKIDAIIQEIASPQTEAQLAAQSKNFSNINSADLNEIDKIIEEMENLRATIPRRHIDDHEPPFKHKENIVMKETSEHQSPIESKNQMRDISHIIEDIRRYESEPRFVKGDSSNKLGEDLKITEELINDIEAYQSQPTISSFSNPKNIQREKDSQAIDDTFRDVVTHGIDQMLAGMENKNDRAKENRHQSELRETAYKMSGVKGQQQYKSPAVHDFVVHNKGQKSSTTNSEMRGMGHWKTRNNETNAKVLEHLKQKQHLDAIDAEMADTARLSSQNIGTADQDFGHENFKEYLNAIDGETAPTQSLKNKKFGSYDTNFGPEKHSQYFDVVDGESGEQSLSEINAQINENGKQQTHPIEKKTSYHQPRHGKSDEEVHKMNALIKEIQNVARLGRKKGHGGKLNRGMDNTIEHMETTEHNSKVTASDQKTQLPYVELEMLDKVIKEIGQIARQEQKHVDEESTQENLQQIDNLVQGMHPKKKHDELSPAKNERISQHPKVAEINRIIEDLERESSIERDLQQALDEVKYSDTVVAGTRNKILPETDQATDEIHKSSINAQTHPHEDAFTSFQTPEEAKEIDKLIHEMESNHPKLFDAELKSQLQQTGNRAKEKKIHRTLEGFPVFPDLQKQRSEEEEAEIAAVNSHLKKSNEKEAVSPIENMIEEIQAHMNKKTHGLSPTSARELLKSDKFNSADESYLSKLKERRQKLRKTLKRKVHRH